MGNLAGAIASVIQKKAKYVIGWVASVILGISVQWLEANNFKNLIFDDYMPGWSNDRTNERPGHVITLDQSEASILSNDRSLQHCSSQARPSKCPLINCSHSDSIRGIGFLSGSSAAERYWNSLFIFSALFSWSLWLKLILSRHSRLWVFKYK